MKATKKLVSYFGAAILAFGLLAGCSNESDSGSDNAPTLKGISVKTEANKKSFAVGEEFTYEGLTLNAKYNRGGDKTITEGFKVSVAPSYLLEDGKTLCLTAEDGHKNEEVPVSIDYSGKKAMYTITIAEAPSAITIDTSTVKTAYFKGQSFDSTGLVVKAVYDSGEEDVTPAISTVDTSTSGVKTVTVSYPGVDSQTFEVKVYELSADLPTGFTTGDDVPAFTDVKVMLGETEISDAALKVVNTNNETITGTFTDNGAYKVTATIDGVELTVKEFNVVKAAQSITIDTTNVKKAYFVNDTTDLSGLVVTAVYAENDSAEVTDYEISTIDTSASGEKTVTISYPKVDAQTFIVKVYEVSGTVETTGLEAGDDIPSLAGITVKCGETTVTSEVKVLDSDNTEVTAFAAAGTYKIVVTVDGIKKEIASFEVKTSNKPVALPLNASKSKIEGASIWVGLNNADKTISGTTAADILKTAEISVTTLEGTAVELNSENKASFGGYEDNETKLVLFINMKDASKTSVIANVQYTTSNGTYKGSVRFINGEYVPANYTVTELKVSAAASKLSANGTTTFTAKDQYNQAATVTWTADKGTIDSTTGEYTAPATIDEDAVATITATHVNGVYKSATIDLKANAAEAVSEWTISVGSIQGAAGVWNFKWSDSTYELGADCLVIEKSKIDGANVQQINWNRANADGTSWDINMFPNNGAVWAGKSSVSFSFELNAKSGKVYTVTGTMDMDSKIAKDVTVTLVKMISLSETKVDFNGTTAAAKKIEVSAVGFTLDSEKLSATSDTKTVATVTVDAENSKVVITPVANGDAVITVSYNEDGIADKTIKVHVGARKNYFSLKESNTSAGYTINANNGTYTFTSTKDKPGEWDDQVFFYLSDNVLAKDDVYTAKVTVTVDKACTVFAKVQYHSTAYSGVDETHAMKANETYTFVIEGKASELSNPSILFALRGHESDMNVTVKDFTIYKEEVNQQ